VQIGRVSSYSQYTRGVNDTPLFQTHVCDMCPSGASRAHQNIGCSPLGRSAPWVRTPGQHAVPPRPPRQGPALRALRGLDPLVLRI